MKRILSFILLVCFASTLSAQTIVSTEPSNRNIILEEFTGKGCTWCPAGHKIAQQLMNYYPGRFFAINVHTGGYASGTPNYQTPYGAALASQSGLFGYPAGTVNRQAFEGIPTQNNNGQYAALAYDRNRWSACASRGLQEPSCLNVAAKGFLDTLTRKLTLLVEVYYTANAVETTNSLTVAMLQNEILGPQTGMSNYPEMIDPETGLYRHMHMLRDFITGTQWGMNVSPTTAGSFWSHTFEYDIPEQFNNIPVVLANLEFIVFVAENRRTIITGSEAIISYEEEQQIEYTVTASAGAHGTISPTDTMVFLEGSEATYTFTPDAYYEVEEVYLNGEPMGLAQATEYSFIVNGNYSIHVTFRFQQEIYSIITASAGEHGTISDTGEMIWEKGIDKEYTFTPDEDYEVYELFIDNEPVAIEPDATSYTFTNLDQDHTIHVTFRHINGIKDLNGIGISIAPNPVKDKLYITGTYDKLQIISISGQVLTTVHHQSTVDVSNLAQGLYFVRVEANGKVGAFKVVK